MCKVLIMTGIKDNDAALEFMKAAEPEMTKGNTDGIGYSAINSKNELFMEKWHNNRHFLNTTNVITENVLEELNPAIDGINTVLTKYNLNKVSSPSVNYMKSGEITRDDLRTVTMHTRFATCGRTMENTHPFVDQGVSLIHNGVISNSHQLGLNKISTCDSEVALQQYINKNIVEARKDAIQSDFLDVLRGYWAFGILAKNSSGTYQLDVFKGGAQLYFAYIPELGDGNSLVFATSEEIIKTACKTTGFSNPVIENLKDNYLGRFNALTGKMILDLDLKKVNSYSAYSYSPKTYSDLKDDTARSGFLNRDKKKESSTLIKHGGEDAIIPEDAPLSDFELEVFDTDFLNIIQALDEYDTFLGSNYLYFYEKIPYTLQGMIVNKRDAGKLKFKDLLSVIEEFNSYGYVKAQNLILKVAA